jgi:DNA-binding beta-propeller fold protein YncE
MKLSRSRRWCVSIASCVAVFLAAAHSPAQSIDLDAVTAQEELRWGVRAFHNGFYNQAILSLNRALAFEPDNVLARFWLGRSYYHSGFEEAGLQEWKTILQAGEGTSHLANFVEIVESRRGLGRELAGEARFVVSTRIEGVQADATVFRGPTSIRPREDGSFFVVGFANHLVQLFDVNGTVRRTLRGGLEGYNRPFDVYEAADGTVFVTEFGADRVSHCRPDGTKLTVFGEAGIGPGQLLGPQYIDGDGDGFLYVSDSGNARVVKFDDDGSFVLSFGRPTRFFDGLSDPVGIVVMNENVFVLDAGRKELVVFDPSGNYVRSHSGLDLVRPEGLAGDGSGRLLIADRQHVVRFDPATETTRRIGQGDGVAPSLTFASLDVNGNLLASDFRADEVLVFANIDSLYSGLFVRTERVASDRFPDIAVDVTVQDRAGRPVVGLDARNFLITESQVPVEEPELVMATGLSERANLAFLVERSPAMANNSELLGEAVRKVLQTLDGDDRRWLVTAGSEPVVDADPAVGNLEFVERAVNAGDYAGDWSFDLGVRLAASQLIRVRGRRALLYFALAPLSESAFENYGLVELMQYLRNNDIAFYPVYLDETRRSAELEYLAVETRGTGHSLRQPEGLAPLLLDVRERSSGRYTFSYVSGSNSDFGRAYIPLEIEAFMMTRSGRDEVGYFAPLEF